MINIIIHLLIFIKNIYNTDGEYIGYYKFIMNYKRKNLILHNCTYENLNKKIDNCVKVENILNKYKRCLGERQLFLIKPISEKPSAKTLAFPAAATKKVE